MKEEISKKILKYREDILGELSKFRESTLNMTIIASLINEMKQELIPFNIKNLDLSTKASVKSLNNFIKDVTYFCEIAGNSQESVD